MYIFAYYTCTVSCPMHDICRICTHLWQLLHWVQIRIKNSESSLKSYEDLLLCLLWGGLPSIRTVRGWSLHFHKLRVCVVPSPVNPYPMGTVESAQAAVDPMYGDMAEFVSMSSQTSNCKRSHRLPTKQETPFNVTITSKFGDIEPLGSLPLNPPPLTARQMERYLRLCVWRV